MAKKKKPNNLDLNARMIVIGAFRYYLGRMTISVSSFTDWLVLNWHSLDEATQSIIARDLEEAFRADDDDQRAQGEVHYRHLGMECDRGSWSLVRALYRTPTCCICGKELDMTTPFKMHLDGECTCDDCAPPNCEVCEKPFAFAEQMITDKKTRRARHPGCKPMSHDDTP